MKRSPSSRTALAALAAALTVFTGTALAADATPTADGQTPLKLQLQESRYTQAPLQTPLQTRLRSQATDGWPSEDGAQTQTRTRTQAQVRTRSQVQAQRIPETAGARMGAGGMGSGPGKGR
jgi:hypothetical protein